jgi:hypothetical protein
MPYLFLTQIIIQHPSQDRFQAGGQDMERNAVAHAKVVEGLKPRVDPKRRLHHSESLIERYLRMVSIRLC